MLYNYIRCVVDDHDSAEGPWDTVRCAHGLLARHLIHYKRIIITFIYYVYYYNIIYARTTMGEHRCVVVCNLTSRLIACSENSQFIMRFNNDDKKSWSSFPNDRWTNSLVINARRYNIRYIIGYSFLQRNLLQHYIASNVFIYLLVRRWRRGEWYNVFIVYCYYRCVELRNDNIHNNFLNHFNYFKINVYLKVAP